VEKNREKAWDHFYITDRKLWTRFVPWLRDEIWGWPGDEATSHYKTIIKVTMPHSVTYALAVIQWLVLSLLFITSSILATCTGSDTPRLVLLPIQVACL